MALLWQKHGPHMVVQISSSWIKINVPWDVPCQNQHCWVYLLVIFPRNGQNIALLWPKHGPNKVLWIVFFLNYIQCAKGGSMPISTILGVTHSPLFQEMAKMKPFCGQNMVLTWSFTLFFFLNHNHRAQGCSMPNFTILGVSHSPLFLEMVKIWPFYGQNMVLTWCFKLGFPYSWSMCPGMFHAKFHIAGSIL